MISSSLMTRAKSYQDRERGLTGLQNIGNTCFLNSVIQCLSNTKPLLEYILNQEYENEIKNPSRCLLIKRFCELIHNIWGEQRGSLNTHQLKNAVVLYAPRFNGYSQQDAQEFLRYLLEGLHEEINRTDNQAARAIPENKLRSESLTPDETWRRYIKSDNSKVVDTFGGLLKSVLKCTYCGFSSTIYEPFWDLSLPIPLNSGHSHFHKLQLNQCLDFFTKEETLDGNEKPTCSKCKVRQTCIKKISIQRFPHILVIHLKRFSANGVSQKVDSYVDFPILGLNMAAYAAEEKFQNITYNLYGVVNHFGTCQYGHYTAYCKHPFSGEWHRFSDRVVSVMDPEMTEKSEAYILFYETNTCEDFKK